MTITTIIGARPQFVKAAVVSHALMLAGVTETIVHTGQHYDANMSDVFFRELGIPQPDHNLGIGGGTHGQNTGRMIEAIEGLLLSDRPDAVLVYGDTDSTLAGALAACKLHVPVAHVEAGLRSFNRAMPEELNRVLTDHASSVLFAPTEVAVQHLVSEGIGDSRVRLVGDVMYDAALVFGDKAAQESAVLERLLLEPQDYVLATVHRAENADSSERLQAIIGGFRETDMNVVLPLHPRTRARLSQFKIELPGNVRAIDPVGFLDMLQLEQNARLIATDSGGVQKEAFFHKVPCVTLRGETEWTELVESGWNRVVPPTDASSIARALAESVGTRGQDVSPYGTGNAADLIAGSLTD